MEIVQIAPADGAPEGFQFVDVTYHQFAATVVDAQGVVISTKPEETFDGRILLEWREDKWIVSGMA